MVQQNEGRVPLIVAFIDDLMTTTRIEIVATQLGYQVESVDSTKRFMTDEAFDQPTRPGEPVTGPLAPLIDQITSWQPALLIFDLSNTAVPWRDWLAILKSSPATRRIPVVCFGPHIDKVSLADATSLTLEEDAVVPRSRFFASMPELIAETARITDYNALQQDCLAGLSNDALRGLQAFDVRRYFDAHEHLEDAWNAEEGPAKELYRAVLQVAVAYLQIERRNYRGAMKMFLRARQWLSPLPDQCRGIDVARLRLDAESVRESLVELGPAGIDQFDITTLPPVHYDPGTSRPEHRGLPSAN
ncbi:MAG: DUF309 domain-containing protein [Chloroflexota bacterium]